MRVISGGSGGGGGGGITELTGDVTGGGTGSVAVTLATSGVDAGIYTNPTLVVDAKGRVTGAADGAGVDEVLLWLGI